MILKELIFNSFYFGRVWGGLERTESTDYYFYLACKFCMLHGFKEPTT